MMELTYNIRCPFGSDWKIDRRIGKGSYGEVYLISKKADGSNEPDKSAMKIIRIPANENEPRMLMDRYEWTLDRVKDKYAQMVSAAQKEIDILRRFKAESHIVSYEDCKIIEHKSGVGADIYLKMELLTPLDQWQMSRDLKYEQIIRLGIEICEALELCENEGIVHGDIKTDNILVNQRNSFKLGDFGIAKNLSIENNDVEFPQGSLNYLAPEVFHKRRADKRADIYSLGMVLYRLLNDRKIPFLPENNTENMEIEARQRRFAGEELPQPKNGFPALWNVIQKACAFVPESRYQNPTELKKALLAVLNMTEAKEKISIEEMQPIGKAADRHSINTPDLAGDITPGRTPSDNWDKGDNSDDNSDNQDDDDADGEEDDDNEGGGNNWLTKNKGIFIGIALICCIGILCLLLIPRKPVPVDNIDEKVNTESIKVQSEPALFSMDIILSGGRAPFELSINCGESELQKLSSKQNRVRIENLAPKTHYTVSVIDSQGEHGSLEINTLECDSYSGEAFRVTDMRLYKCNRLDLQGTTFEALLSKSEERYVTSVADGNLQLRNATATAQEDCYCIAIQITQGTEKQGINGALVFRTNDSESGIAVTEQIIIPAQKTWAVYPLEDLLSQVYDAYKGWPTGAATLELYTEEHFITEIPITLQMKNVES